jgi:hypothetical protein
MLVAIVGGSSAGGLLPKLDEKVSVHHLALDSALLSVADVATLGAWPFLLLFLPINPCGGTIM